MSLSTKSFQAICHYPPNFTHIKMFFVEKHKMFLAVFVGKHEMFVRKDAGK